MSPKWKRAAAALLALVTIGALAACSSRAPEDGLYLYYSRGMNEGNKFVECIPPSTKGPGTVNDVIFEIPTNLRTWNIRADGGDTNVPLISGSRPDISGQAGPQVKVWATTEFYINTYCGEPGPDGKYKDGSSPIVQFWEKTGRRYGISSDGGEFNVDAWTNLLKNTLVPVIEKRMSEGTRNYWADELDNNLAVGSLNMAGDEKRAAAAAGKTTWAALEADISAGFQQALVDKLGGDFFCGPSYKPGSKDCPPVRVSITDAVYADEGLQAARAATRKAAEDAKKALIDANNQVDVANALSKAAKDSNYMRLKELETNLKIAEACAKAPSCTLVVPNGSSVITQSK